MLTKPLQKNASTHNNQILLSGNRLKQSSWSFTHIFKKIQTTMIWGQVAIQKGLVFYRQRPSPVFIVFFTIKLNVIPKYLINALTDFA